MRGTTDAAGRMMLTKEQRKSHSLRYGGLRRWRELEN